MGIALRRALVGVIFVLLSSWAWWPALSSALHGDEWGQLALARAGGGLFDPSLAGGHPLAAANLRITAGHGTVWLMRAESALWLLFAAWAVGRAARRILLPWSGGELARAAGWATSMLFALHPLATASLASLSARGDLMAVAFGATCVWSYLRARQERDSRLLGLAVASASAAVCSSDLAFGLFAWLAGVEFLSARRQRSTGTRLRSAAAVGAAALVLVALEIGARSVALGRWSPPEVCTQWSPPTDSAALARVVAVALERLGALFVPVNAHIVGAWGFALAGAASLAVLQPILIASRSAPRLWGRILGVWALALIAAECFALRKSVHPDELEQARTLLGAIAVMSVGTGLATVALSGLRRIVLPSAFGLVFAILSHANGLAHLAAGRVTQSVMDLSGESNSASRRFVLDAPATVFGLDAVRGVESALAKHVELVSSGDFARRAQSGELDLERARGRLELARAIDGVWNVLPIASGAPETGPHSWFREGRSPELDLDPWSTRALIVRAEANVDTQTTPILAWSTPESGVREAGRCEGRWSTLGGAPEAVFDLGASIEWLTSSRVRQVWSVEGWSLILQAEFADELPLPAVSPAPIETDRGLEFTTLPGAEAGAEDARREWRFTVFASPRAPSRSFPVRRFGDALRVEGFAPAQFGEPSTMVWWLESTIDGLAIERTRGSFVVR
jgi:hypothetical protein